MAKISVLGCGMVGRAIVLDLAHNHEVLAVDRDEESLHRLKDAANVTTRTADLSKNASIADVVEGAKLVVNATPGFMGYWVLSHLVELGKTVADISFFPEDIRTLDEKAKQTGATVIMDIGVAPGMDNIILGHYDSLMQVQKFDCLVGGLPKKRELPWQYKAPFSPIDVIEEYTRPARYVENGHMVTRPALSDPALEHFEPVGTLESFNTDGLRSIIHTMPHIPNMKERTLRYPGHIALFQAMRDGGFFNEESIQMNNQDVSPLELNSRILLDSWKLGQEEEEFTVMRVEVTGQMDGQEKTITYNLYDEYDPATQVSSMARTTGYTCTAAANYLLEGRFAGAGVYPPEEVSRNNSDCLDYFLNHLADRGVIYRKSET